jgi:hypothetical protein
MQRKKNSEVFMPVTVGESKTGWLGDVKCCLTDGVAWKFEKMKVLW